MLSTSDGCYTLFLWYMTTMIIRLHINLFSLHVIPLTGINHLIVFKTNQFAFLIAIPDSPACSSSLLAIPPLLRHRVLTFSYEGLLRFVLHLAANETQIVCSYKKRGRTEFWSLDPWSSKLLRWPLDHATPL